MHKSLKTLDTRTEIFAESLEATFICSSFLFVFLLYFWLEWPRLMLIVVFSDMFKLTCFIKIAMVFPIYFFGGLVK